jgi:hypothetical protein
MRLAIISAAIAISLNTKCTPKSNNVASSKPTIGLVKEHAFLHEMEVDSLLSIGFTSRNPEFNYYLDPWLITPNDTTPIQGFATGSDEVFRLSPNRSWLMAGRIDQGWVEDGDGRALHDRADCVIIDVAASKVIAYMTTDCDGQWNAQSEWVNAEGKVIRF